MEVFSLGRPRPPTMQTAAWLTPLPGEGAWKPRGGRLLAFLAWLPSVPTPWGRQSRSRVTGWREGTSTTPTAKRFRRHLRATKLFPSSFTTQPLLGPMALMPKK